jgi:hypothetical protein
MRGKNNKMLNDMIYNYFSESDKERNTKEFDSEGTLFFNPSSFSACKRQIFFKKRYVAPSNPIDSVALLKMQFGTVLHTSIQNVIKNLGILIEAERLRVKEFDGLQFRYKTDGIIVLNRQRTIMEIKTVSSGGLRVVRDEPKFEDVVQMVLYMLFEEILNGVLLYIGRDSALIEEYTVHAEDYQYKKALNTITEKAKELKILEGQIKRGIMPERDCQIALKNKDGKISNDFQKNKTRCVSDWRCRYCQWYDLCWRKELEEIKDHKFFVEGEFID